MGDGGQGSGRGPPSASDATEGQRRRRAVKTPPALTFRQPLASLTRAFRGAGGGGRAEAASPWSHRATGLDCEVKKQRHQVKSPSPGR